MTGGISSIWSQVQAGFALISVAVLGGLAWLAIRDFRKIPIWLAMVIFLQGLNMAFLIYYEVKKGSVFEPEVPAFATARYFALVQPLTLACIFWVMQAAQPLAFVRRAGLWITMFLFLTTGTSFISYNWDSIRGKLAIAQNGLLIPKKYVELQRRLLEIQPDVWIVLEGRGSKEKLYDAAKTIKHEQSLYNAKKIFDKSVEACIQQSKLVVLESVGGEIIDIRETLQRIENQGGEN